ncbi:MAG: hypothetical protein MUO31_01275 [Thermodesulfovibrionales bacterium]|nr:hypothetical protein [Thermodesulfovibrionales bacterium]
MRYLSQREKELIVKLKNIDRKDIPTLLDPYLDRMRIVPNKGEGKVELQFQTHKKEPSEIELGEIEEKINTISKIIVTLINLLALLEREGYIQFFEEANIIPNGIGFGRIVKDEPYLSFEFPDKGVAKLFREYAFKQIIFTEEMIWFIQNSFITRDEKRHRQSMKLAWISIWISIIIGVASIVIGIISNYKTQTVILSKDQFDKIENRSEKIFAVSETITKQISAIEKKLDQVEKKIVTKQPQIVKNQKK